jgi:hypothetical protein
MSYFYVALNEQMYAKIRAYKKPKPSPYEHA